MCKHLEFAPMICAALLAACGAWAQPDAGEVSLTSHPWQWKAFVSSADQFEVETPQNYQVTFNEDGTVNLVADCNKAAGSYTVKDGGLQVAVNQMTKVACPTGSRGDQFVKLLGAAGSHFFVEGALFVSLQDNGGVMRFGPPAAPAASTADPGTAALTKLIIAGLVANPWKWSTYTTAAGALPIETPASYQLTFQEDGTVLIKADCNQARGTYAVHGLKLTISIGPATLAACPGQSRSEQFLQILAEAAACRAFGDGLQIMLQTEGSSLRFEPIVTTVADLCGEQALALHTIDNSLAPETAAKLDQVLLGLVTKGARVGPGAVLLIVTPKGRYLKSVGMADLSTREPLRADSPFQIGSNTKMMTSAILYQLQEEGRLKISDPLRKWLPELAAQLPNGDKITIDMMLTHTSGLHDYFEVPTADGLSIADGVTDKGMLTRAFTPEELVTLVAGSGLSDFEPAAEGRWNYSNTGYILLGRIIERASGKSYEENLRQRIFAPLGLKQTYLQTGLPQRGALPQAYVKTPFDFTTSDWNASQGWSAGAVVSTPDELAVFLKALFTGRLFHDSGTLELMKQHPAASVDRLAPGTAYAHGMLHNNGVLGHGGQTLGFQSDGGFLPDQDVTIVMWSNAMESNVSRTLVPTIAAIVTGGGQAAPGAEVRPRPSVFPGRRLRPRAGAGRAGH